VCVNNEKIEIRGVLKNASFYSISISVSSAPLIDLHRGISRDTNQSLISYACSAFMGLTEIENQAHFI